MDVPIFANYIAGNIPGYSFGKFIESLGSPTGVYELSVGGTYNLIYSFASDEYVTPQYILDNYRGGTLPLDTNERAWLSVPSHTTTFDISYPSSMSLEQAKAIIAAMNTYFMGPFQFDDGFVQPCPIHLKARGYSQHSLQGINSEAQFLELPDDTITIVDDVAWCGSSSYVWDGCTDVNGSGRIVVQKPMSLSSDLHYRTLWQRLAHEVQHYFNQNISHTNASNHLMRATYSSNNYRYDENSCWTSLYKIWSGL